VTAPGEARWLFSYSILSFIYRIGIAVSIALFIAGKFFFIGVVLAIWALGNMFVYPLGKGIWYVLTNPSLRDRRGRAVMVSAAIAAVPVAVLLLVPLPYATLAEGVVLAPQSAVLRTDTDGFLTALSAEPSSTVAEGQPLLQLEDPLIATRVALLETQLTELRQRLAAAGVLDRVQAASLRAQVGHIEESLALERARMDDLTLIAPRSGRYLTSVDPTYINYFVRKGQEVGYVVQPGELVLRAIVPQTRVDLVRQRAGDVRVRFASDAVTVRSAEILREVAESRELPAPALATAGGGTLVVDPTDPEGRRLLQPAFQIDLMPLDPPGALRIGERVWVRFDHGSEPLATRIYRGVRQLFLGRFDV
jgi:putative peptide zinc metalloprotease protein